MARVRRTPFTFFYLEDDPSVDVSAILRGELPPPRADAGILALALLKGERHRLRRDEFDLLLSFPASRWVDVDDGADRSMLGRLINNGLLLSDAADEVCAAMRERDAALDVNQWNVLAAVYHYMTQWSGVELKEGQWEPTQLKARSQGVAQAHVNAYGPPPGAFHEIASTYNVKLPRGDRDGALYRTLMARRTSRSFDPSTPMSLEHLGAVMRYVFGCHGYTRNVADDICIKRTSPSGGGMHPIEAYPIVTKVAGVEAGIYHYNARDHTLTRLSALQPDESERMATSFMCGQHYFGAAHVSFVLTARFYRSYWKYRRHQKAYAGVLMDAAHLSQTLYLVGAELGIGTFVTLAINARDIEQRLRIDGISEGVVAMIGCGPLDPGESPLEPHFVADPEDL